MEGREIEVADIRDSSPIAAMKARLAVASRMNADGRNGRSSCSNA